MQQRSIDPLSMRGLTSRYLVALGLVALLSFTAFLVMRSVISTQETAAAEVNVAGRQRMLSQRIAWESHKLVSEHDVQQRQRIAASLRANLADFLESHHDLLHGDAARHLPGDPSAAILAMHQREPWHLDRLVAEYQRRVASLLAAPPAPGETDDADLAVIRQLGEGPLLAALDRVVEQYQRESEREIRWLLRGEMIIFALTLITLTLEALLIFRPMVTKVVDERRRLRQAEGRIRSIVDHCHDGILTLDQAGTITWANPAAARIAGRTRSELAGLSLGDLVAGSSDIHQVMERDRSSLDQADGVRSLALSRPDGSSITVDVAYSTMQDGDEKLVVAIIRESTEQLKHYAARLERSHRELDQFAYVASHDFKAPLRAISNLAAWIDEDLGDRGGPVVREHLDLLRGRVMRLESLIEGLRRYATAVDAPLANEEIDLERLVRDIFEEQRQDRAFDLALTLAVRHIHGNRIGLWQVLSNLIANAIKHHHRAGGTIAVAIHAVATGIEVVVEDDGPGIAPEHHDKVFVIFQTLKPKDHADSLGLGLALVKKIVTAQGGDVGISAGTTGARFTFTWPCEALVAAP